MAAGDGEVPATIEEARLLPTFVEYNFKQDLNLLAESYRVFFLITVILLTAAALFSKTKTMLTRSIEHEAYHF